MQAEILLRKILLTEFRASSNTNKEWRVQRNGLERVVALFKAIIRVKTNLYNIERASKSDFCVSVLASE